MTREQHQWNQRAQTTINRLITQEGSIPFATSHPAGVPTGYTQYRTDLGLVEYYDGTRWLTTHEYVQDMPIYGRHGFPYGGGATTLMLSPLRTDRQIYYTRGKTYIDVVAPNTGAAFWSFTASIGATAVWSYDTSGDAPGVNINKEDATAAITAGPPTYARLDVSKTGAPGTVVVAFSFWYRLVIP